MHRHLTAMLTAGVLIAGSSMASARDSFSKQYDLNKPAHIVGTVTSVDWNKTRSFLTIEGTGPNGRLTEFRVELGSRRDLESKGWRPDTVTEGETLRVKGWYARNDRALIKARVVTSLGTKVNKGLTFTQATRLYQGRPEYALHFPR